MNFLQNDLTSVNILQNGPLFACQYGFETKFLLFASEGKTPLQSRKFNESLNIANRFLRDVVN